MKTSKSGETFLTNKSKVSGVQDVITRMKTEEYEEGDTEEDIAARGLLNRFIGKFWFNILVEYYYIITDIYLITLFF